MPPTSPSTVVVIGVGDDGWSGLSRAHQRRILEAEVVLGGERHLAMLPADVDQERLAWPSPLREGLPALLWQHDTRRVVALASGDPFVSGIASTLVELLGADAVEVHPAVSSVALACARMRWDAATVQVVTVVGRRPETVVRELAPGRRLVVLSSDAGTPAVLARLLVEHGYGGSAMSVLSHLGGERERRLDAAAGAWDDALSVQVPDLNVVALDLRGPVVGSWVAGLPDDAYEHDGQLTKRDLRAAALARLAPQPGQLLWDVGAGAGSVGIEWMRAHPGCRTIAIEADAERAERVARNAARLGVPALSVTTGRAPEVLDDLAAPDAVFVGGGATAPGLLDLCRERLRPGGRLVAHGVTVESEQLLAAAYAVHGGELTRTSVEHAAPLGSFTGWTPARAVTQWAWTKPLTTSQETS
ncbi:Precorrin-6Y C(5,15)-methyltransferase [decarboxylating] [Nocardioides dokdonensis FR1436]|uniref:Precorrin-6Y C(5,15)-methyltransferase [decarboxylating] n=1 Tax=Nocardioides dokdonensis FR1436 TaxID=1300347 RepID=A0A1A9GRJ9_9ACTN|nr:bifunctional cobalt-precorrin-7 (C(5))-methyltransferase/cobalt-precorrin-6B (C(15))-methyltransferase [Nocardioides dokdonensis]ANH40242.1 Precorrin-6Y C(5,15)-methyltransferase [decarboxylating] [Nocardioides dokdonensis FR1436]